MRWPKKLLEVIILPKFSNTQELQERLLLERVCHTVKLNMRRHPPHKYCPLCNACSDIREINKFSYQITYKIEIGFDYYTGRHFVKKLTFLCDCYDFYPCGKRSEWLEIINNIKKEYQQPYLDVYIEQQDKETGQSSTLKDNLLSKGRI